MLVKQEWVCKDKEEGKDKESIQSSSTPDPFSTTTSPFLPNAK